MRWEVWGGGRWFFPAQNHNNTLWLNVNHIFPPQFKCKHKTHKQSPSILSMVFTFSLSRGSHFAALSAISHYIEFSRDKIDILIHLSIGNTNWRHSSITSKFISTDVQIDDDRKFTAAVVVVSFFPSFAHTQWTPNVSNINETKIIRWRRRIKWIFQASKKKNCFQYSNGIVLWISG